MTEPERAALGFTDAEPQRPEPNEAGFERQDARSFGGVPIKTAHTWEPTVTMGHTIEDVSLDEWVYQALGAASSCWESLRGAGTFESERCKAVGEALMARINEAVKGGEAYKRGYQTALDERALLYCSHCGHKPENLEAGKVHLQEKHPTAKQATTRDLLEELRVRLAHLPNSVEAVNYLSSGLRLPELNARRDG